MSVCSMLYCWILKQYLTHNTFIFFNEWMKKKRERERDVERGEMMSFCIPV